mmetsp:Transcript_12369/g.36759  ORF Transcript_12369/g.36759 Transcript_12369/m.36759 type:complete len:112 (-) Transcript_12369:31-366(-)
MLRLLLVAAGAFAASVTRRQAVRGAGLGVFGAAPAAAKTYKSGKNPDGKKDPNDTAGTKKDGSYLQCLAGCASRCESASMERRKTRAECLNLCRDECCATYEQCTYTIPGT